MIGSFRFAPAELLRCCVLGRQYDLLRASHRGIVGCSFRVHELCDAEIEQLDDAIARDEHVGRLQVAMNDKRTYAARADLY